MFEAFIERNARIARSNQVLIALRLLFATIALAVLIVSEHELLKKALSPESVAPLYSRPPGFVALVVLVLTIIYLLLVRVVHNKPLVAAKLAAIQIVVDIFLISCLIWRTGGVESQFVVLYLISICSAGFVLKWNASIVAAALSSILFASIAILYSVGIMPDEFRNDPATLRIMSGTMIGLSFIRYLLLPVFAFGVAGIIAGEISKRLVAASLMRDDILEGIGKGVLMLDPKGAIVYHNGEFSRMLGLDGQKVSTFPLSRLLGEEIEHQAQEVLKSNESRKIEIAHKRRDQSMLPLMVRINPIAEPGGSGPHGLIIALDDITNEKKMAEFANQKQRIATMGQISATIAHEIRNPLSSIRGAVQEIVRSVDVPEGKRILLEIVLSESDRLDQIITDFLQFARMRPPGLIKTDIRRVLSDVRYLLCARPESIDIQITVGGDPGEMIAVDPEQMRQLLLNLGLNALQALEGCPRKQIKITATRVTSVPADSGYNPARLPDRRNRPAVVIAVEDTGEGMIPAVKQQVFEPFFTTKPAGTGLGLAIVERIVHSHDGMIAVDSEQGKGTTIRVWIPADLKVGAVMAEPHQAIVL